MTITQQRVTCKCGHVFEADLVTDAPLAITIASMKAIHCPKCGSSECCIGGGYDDAPPLTAPIAERAAWWRERGEVGTSSESIWSAFAGSGIRHPCYPLDPDDFRRCRLLLALIPEWRADLSPLVARYPWFAPFVDRWDEMDRLFDLEAPTGSCEKLTCGVLGHYRRTCPTTAQSRNVAVNGVVAA